MSRANKLIQDGALIAGQFRLGRELGRGGMGTVWSAEDLRLGRPVAIKFLSNDFFDDQQARQRFEREPRLAGKIRSPHVVQVYAEGTTDDGTPYLVMELLDGEDLSARIARQGKCTLVEAGAIVEQICRVLSRAHREGLVHRDIKPHNIFLTPEADDQVFVKLLDFGIAKDARAPVTALTLTGEVMGSALYISPEQLREAHTVGPSADIWALGVVIYEMLTARVPFEGNTLHEVFYRLTEGKFTPATQLSPGLPSAVDGFLAKVIQPDRALRFSTVDELASAFMRIVRAHSSGLLTKPSAAGSAPPAAYGGMASQPGAATPLRAAPPASQMRWLAAAALVVLLAGLVWFFSLRRSAAPQASPSFDAQPAPAASDSAPLEIVPTPSATQPTILPAPTLAEPAAQAPARELAPQPRAPKPAIKREHFAPATTPKPNRNYGF